MNLPLRVRDYCREAGFPLNGEDRILCAVSGGMDSMALLHCLHELGCPVAAASYDHGIRAEGGADAAFVEDWCRARQIPCVTGRGDVPGWAKQRGLTLEEAGRELRYRFLRQSADRLDCRYIATGHNADDQAETMLLRLLRGTGGKGLGGIPPKREEIIRPLLPFTRAEIQIYCLERRIPHVEDASNADLEYTRNYIRHQVMPLLREKNPSLTAGLARTAQSLRRDEDFFCQTVDRAFHELVRREKEGCVVSRARLLELHPAVSLRLLERMAAELSDVVLTARQRERLLWLAESEDPAGRYSLSGGLTGGRSYDELWIRREEQEAGSFSPVVLTAGESCEIPELALTVSCREEICPKEREGIWLSGGWSELMIRPRQEGDRIRLPGRPEKRLKKLMIEKKIPRELRERIPVLICGGEVAAVAGLGVSDQYIPKAGERARQIIFKEQRKRRD